MIQETLSYIETFTFKHRNWASNLLAIALDINQNELNFYNLLSNFYLKGIESLSQTIIFYVLAIQRTIDL